MDNTFKGLLDQIALKTKAGKANWLPSDSPNEYRLILNDAIITISIYRSKLNVGVVDCTLTNKRGDIIFRENVAQSSETGQYLVDLYSLIRDTYTGKDAVISSILQELNGNGILGMPTKKEEEELPF